MRMFFKLLLLPALAAGLCLAAPAGASTSAAKSSGTARSKPALQTNDAQLESTIRAKLAKSKIGKDGFRFKVARGVVTWEGSTGVPQHKGAATRMARTAGASQVVNNIQVAGGVKPGTPMKKAYVQ